MVQIGIPIEGSSGNLLYTVYQREADLLVQSRNLEALWVVNLDRELAASAPRAGQLGTATESAADVFADHAQSVVESALDRGEVVSEASLSLLAPSERGIWVASPVINAGGIPIGAIAMAISLDDIAGTVMSEFSKTSLIALVLFALTAAGALWGTRWLTRPIEAIASAAQQVEMGQMPDARLIEPVAERTDELGRLARVFDAMTIQVFDREEQLELMVAARTAELEESNQSLRRAHKAMQQDLEMARVVQAALVREGDLEVEDFSAYARMTPASRWAAISWTCSSPQTAGSSSVSVTFRGRVWPQPSSWRPRRGPSTRPRQRTRRSISGRLRTKRTASYAVRIRWDSS